MVEQPWNNRHGLENITLTEGVQEDVGGPSPAPQGCDNDISI